MVSNPIKQKRTQSIFFSFSLNIKKKTYKKLANLKNKLYSCGFVYTIDKPKLAVIESGDYSRILWKCANPRCKGRAKSDKLVPPLEITAAHTADLPDTSQLTRLQHKESVTSQAESLSDAPRTIIINAQKSLKKTDLWKLNRPEAIRQLIIRRRKKRFQCKGIYCIYFKLI